MNLNPREWEWTDNYTAYLDNDEKVMLTLMSTGATAILWVIVGAVVDSLGMLPGLWIPILTILSLTLGTHVYWLPRTNKLAKVNDESMRTIGQKYFRLSKSDQREFFPRGFVEILKSSNHMTHQEISGIYHESNSIFNNVYARDKAIADAEAKQRLEKARAPIDADSIISELRRGRDHAQIEAETMKEYL